jgi:hypothetical protein
MAACLVGVSPGGVSAGEPAEAATRAMPDSVVIAGAAAAKSRKCGRGYLTARLNRKPGCINRKSLRRGVPKSAKGIERRPFVVATSPGLLHRLLGRSRGARRVARQGRTLLRQANVLKARISETAAAASSAPIVRPATPREGQITTGGSARNVQPSGSGTAEVSVDDTGRVAECPTAEGQLPGSVRYGIGQKVTVPLPGRARRRFVGESSVLATAKLTGHVGGDARLRSYDLVGEVRVRSSGRELGPAGIVHKTHDKPVDMRVRISLTGLRPGMTSATMISPARTKSITFTEGGRSGQATRDARGNIRMPVQIQEAVSAFLLILPRKAESLLESAERVYHDRAACLAATFQPSRLSLTAGSASPLRATVARRDGTRAALALEASTSDARVSPDRSETTATAPARFNVTPTASAGEARVFVEGRSREGRVRGSVAGSIGGEIYSYRVTISGSGSYKETSGHRHPSGEEWDHHFDIPRFTFSTVWMFVIIPLDGKPPVQPTFWGHEHTLSGSVKNTGDYRGDPPSTYSCDLSLSAAHVNPAGNKIELGAFTGGSQRITLSGFHFMGRGPGTECTSTPAADGHFSYPSGAVVGPGSSDIPAGATKTISLTAAQLRQPRFTLALSSDPFPLHCTTHTAVDPCTHTLTWSATATFERMSTCSRVPMRDAYTC